jgi:parvulin-like peptidyl-prolyl isomerase
MKLSEAHYLAGGIIGLVMALFGAIGAPHIEQTGGAAAIVNGVPIPREAIARAVLALAADSRNPVTPEREADVLERLIEEELLVQRGVELGLPETDFAARRALVQSVLQLAMAERSGDEPSDEELRRFYRTNAGFFAPAPRFSASVVFFRDGAGAQRIEAARTALAAGRDAHGLGDMLTLPIPHNALAQNEWARLIGADAASAAAGIAPGEVTAPVTASGGVFLIRVDAFAAAPAPTYESVAAQVRAEYERRADEAVVQAYIDRLKRAARIERRDAAL